RSDAGSPESQPPRLTNPPAPARDRRVTPRRRPTGRALRHGGTHAMSDIGDPVAPDNDPEPAISEPGDTPADDPAPVNHEAEAAKWRAMARKHEAAAKANADAAKELEA